MTKTFAQMRAELEQKMGTIQTLLQKGDDLTVDDLNQVTALNTEMKTLQESLEQSAATLQEARAADEARRKLLSTPERPPVHPDGPTAHLLGMTQAGSTLVEHTERGQERSISVLDQIGDGLIDDAAWKAIQTPEYKSAFRKWLRGKGSESVMSAAEMKTLQVGVDDQGGFTVPEDFLNRVIQRKPAPSRVAGNVQQLNTSRDAITIPKVNYSTDNIYTTGMRVTWTGEIPATDTVHRVTEPVFGQFRAQVYTAMMSLPVSYDMLEDSVFPVMAWSADKFGETIDLLKDNMILNGTGINQPAGILLNPGGADQPAVVNSGAAAALTADGLQNIFWDVPEQYEDNFRYVMNKASSGKAISGLKDGQNRYLWGSGLQDSGMRNNLKDRDLFGFPVVFSAFMPDVAANAYPIIAGDLTGYYLINRIGFSIQVIREKYAEQNQVVLLGRIRIGGQVAEPWKMRIQQVHV